MRVVSMAIGVALGCGVSHAGVSLTVLPGGVGDDRGFAVGLSADGGIVSGGSGTLAARRGVAWKFDGASWAITDLPGLGATTFSTPNALSSDGTTATGISANRPVVWRGVGSLSPTIETVYADTRTGQGTGVSADGSVVTGYAVYAGPFVAFRDDGTTLDPLGLLPGGTTTQAQAISGDGALVVGTGSSSTGQKGWTWTEADGLLGIDSPGYIFSQCKSVSADGSAIGGGVSNNTNTLTEPCVWRGDELDVLAMPAGTARSLVLGLSGDGHVGVGLANFGPAAADPSTAVYWVNGAVVELGPELAFRGVDMTDLVLQTVTAVSPDGTRVVGNGQNTQSGLLFAFIAEIDTACNDIDFNNDGVSPDTADLLEFLAVFSGAECAACDGVDFNNDGVWPDLVDVFGMLRVFSGGACTE